MLVFYCRSTNEQSLYQGLEAAACAFALGQSVKVIFNSNAIQILKNQIQQTSQLTLKDYFILLDSHWIELKQDESINSFVAHAKSILVF